MNDEEFIGILEDKVTAWMRDLRVVAERKAAESGRISQEELQWLGRYTILVINGYQHMAEHKNCSQKSWMRKRYATGQ